MGRDGQYSIIPFLCVFHSLQTQSSSIREDRLLTPAVADIPLQCLDSTSSQLVCYWVRGLDMFDPELSISKEICFLQPMFRSGEFLNDAHRLEDQYCVL